MDRTQSIQPLILCREEWRKMKGRKLNHLTSELCERFAIKAWLGLRKTLSPLRENLVHEGWIERACKSLTCLAEAKTRSRAVLKDKSLREISPRDSKGCRDDASSTMERSHSGTALLVTGKEWWTPFINLQIRGCCPTVVPSNPT